MVVKDFAENAVLFAMKTKARLILVVGNSRSGTTMMGRIIGRHTKAFTFNELHFFEELWFPTDEVIALETEEAVTLMSHLFAIQRNGYFTQGDINEFSDEAVALVSEMKRPLSAPDIYDTFMSYETYLHTKQIACDQTPRNVYYLKELLDLYPDAYVLNMIRDPRAILLSQKNRWKGRFSGSRKIPFFHIIRTWADYHPVTISLLWRSGVRAGDVFADHPRVKPIRFEDLTNQPEHTVMEICEFLEIEFEPDMLNVPHTNSSNRKDNPDKAGVDPWIADRWKQGGLSNTDIFINQKLVHTEMGRHKYDFLDIRPNPLLLVVQTIGWFFKMGFAFFLNIRRVKNLGPALKKRLLG